MNPNNEKGSILIITVLFVLVFTSLGLGSIYFSDVQNEATEKLKFSAGAFWLADAGIERAKSLLPGTTMTPDPYDPNGLCNCTGLSTGTCECQNVALGNGAYNVTSDFDVCGHQVVGGILVPVQCVDRFVVNSEGTVNGYRRAIRAVIGRYDIDKVLTTRGPIKNYDPEEDSDPEADPPYCDPPSSVNWICADVEPESEFSLESIFGLTLADFYNTPHNYFEDPPNNAMTEDDVNGFSIIKLVGSSKVQIPSNNSLPGEEGFILIDATQCTVASGCLKKVGDLPEVNIEGDYFNGIIYILGEAKFAGNPDIHGAIFVEGSPMEITPVTGNASFTYDAQAIADAVDDVGNPNLSDYSIISWKEI